MAKGSYQGGGTIVSAGNNPDWFGDGDVEVPLEERRARIRDELKRKAKAEPDGKWSAVERQIRDALQVGVTESEIERLAELPGEASTRKPLDDLTQAKIVALKRDVTAFASQARSALSMHEKLRQQLIKILAEHHIPESTCQETRKFIL